MNFIKRLLEESAYKYLLLSTTAKDNKDYLILPDRKINEKLAFNLIVGSEDIAKQLLQTVDGLIDTIFVDVEKKQSIDLWNIAQVVCIKSFIVPYKPNDITMEAADKLLNHHFQNNIESKKILIYGTGNISFKLALRLAEKNAKIYLLGRNLKKLEKLAETINLVIPNYTLHNVTSFDYSVELDAIVSFVSAEKVVPGNMSNYLKSGGIAVDGGIGNFSESFIEESIKKEIKVRRLDVRIGLPFIYANLEAVKQNFFEDVMGEKIILGAKVVSGGVIGDVGSIIVDQIAKPSQVIGIANGIGGVKNDSILTKGERDSLSSITKYILQSNQKSI